MHIDRLKTKHILAGAAMALALALGACSDRVVEPPPLGDATSHNIAAQIVNPKPVPTDVAPEMNGERDAGALTRYEKGKVIKPENAKTSEIRNNGGGGGGGGGGTP